MRKLTALGLILTLAIALVPLVAEAAIIGRAGVVIDLKDTRTSGTEQGTVTISQAFNWDITNGTGANQASLCWQGVRAVSTGATDDVDLAGSLTNLYGAVVFTQIKLIAIQAAVANTTILTVSRPATAGAPFLDTDGDSFQLGPGDIFMLTRRASGGITVTATTDDIVRLVNAAGATANYTIVVCGAP